MRGLPDRIDQAGKNGAGGLYQLVITHSPCAQGGQAPARLVAARGVVAHDIAFISQRRQGPRNRALVLSGHLGQLHHSQATVCRSRLPGQRLEERQTTGQPVSRLGQ